MTLTDQTLFGTVDKVRVAIERLKTFEPEEGYYLAFSGGKDSIVIKKLADMAGVKYDAHYNNTTIDPPELVRFIRKHHPDVEIHNPKVPFLKELVRKGFPMRQRRWCCEVYKEGGGAGRLVVTGIRWAESKNRDKRKMVESCFKDKSKRYLNEIIDWSNGEVWQFIRKTNIPYCSLYDEGWKRLGCVMCPAATKSIRVKESIRYPKYKQAFIRAFERMYHKKKSEGKTSVGRWKDGKEMFNWWLHKQKKGNPDQMVMFE